MVNGDEYKNIVHGIYLEAFSEEDLREIVNFYKTPTGKKTREKLPFITQRIMDGTGRLADREWPNIVEKIEAAEAEK